jgi:hypothetical protein
MASASVENTDTRMLEMRSFAHILLFRCGDCGGPVTVSCSSKELEREHVATRLFKQVCRCGWWASSSGLTAIRHWVECW